ncbi:MAG: HisS family protein [Planctomycetota bacterium]|nr:HisS family protein [Planctomycetota bacterium]
MDKYDKVGISGVEKELAKRGFSTETVKRTVEFFATAAESQDPLTFVEDKLADNELGKLGLQELKELLGYCEELGLKRGAVEFDPLMVRGLDYYTGPIFEAVTDRLERMGSLAGGGRYDGLIGMFSGQQVPAVGATVGLDRIFTALEQLNLVTRRNTRARVLVAIFDEATAGEARKIAGELRASDIRTAVFPEPDKLRKQFRYADRLGVRYVVLAGPDELNRGTVTLKDLEKGEQREVTRGELVGEVRDQ